MKLRHSALALAIVLVGAACADTTGSTLEVNGEQISRGDVIEVLDAVAVEVEDLENIQPELKARPGSINSDLSAFVLTTMVQNEALRQALAARSLDLTDAELDEARAAAPGGSGSVTVDDLRAEIDARFAAAVDAGIDLAQVSEELVVELDPRFGRWDGATSQVVPNTVPSS